MRILIVDQCSSSKDFPDWFEPLDESTVDGGTLEELLEVEKVPKLPAKDLYIGRQQRLISRAVEQLRAFGDEVDRVFISAGFGVIDEDAHLPPYDVSLTGRPKQEILKRVDKLDIQASLRDLIAQKPTYDVVFFALGQDYYLGIDLRELIDELQDGTMVVLFNQESTAEGYELVLSIPARTDEARENGATVVSLKGQFIKNFSDHRKQGAEVEEPEDLRGYCMSEITNQVHLEDFDE